MGIDVPEIAYFMKELKGIIPDLKYNDIYCGRSKGRD